MTYILYYFMYIPYLIILSNIFLKNYYFVTLYFLCSLLNIFLKKFIFPLIYKYNNTDQLPYIGNIKRPNNFGYLDKIDSLFENKKGYGMPSGHSQGVSFFITYNIINLDSYILNIFYIIIGIFVMYNRYYYNYHTLQQIFIGNLIGISYGILLC